MALFDESDIGPDMDVVEGDFLENFANIFRGDWSFLKHFRKDIRDSFYNPIYCAASLLYPSIRSIYIIKVGIAAYVFYPYMKYYIEVKNCPINPVARAGQSLKRH